MEFIDLRLIVNYYWEYPDKKALRRIPLDIQYTCASNYYENQIPLWNVLHPIPEFSDKWARVEIGNQKVTHKRKREDLPLYFQEEFDYFGHRPRMNGTFSLRHGPKRLPSAPTLKDLALLSVLRTRKFLAEIDKENLDAYLKSIDVLLS